MINRNAFAIAALAAVLSFGAFSGDASAGVRIFESGQNALSPHRPYSTTTAIQRAKRAARIYCRRELGNAYNSPCNYGTFKIRRIICRERVNATRNQTWWLCWAKVRLYVRTR